MKKVVIFGGSGFLGSYVADELTKCGYEVIIADIIKSAYLQNEQRFAQCDILNYENVLECVADADAVYNFAALANLDDAIAKPKLTIELNVIGNINILDACIKAKIKRYLYASSAYAVSKKGSFYGISKHASEQIIEEYARLYGLEYTIIRYGSLYGERADKANYIRRVLLSAIRDKKIELCGSGDELREYIHAKDAAKLSVNVMESDEFINEHIILTGVEKMRRKDLALMIQEILNFELDIEHADSEQIAHYNITPYSFQPSSAKKLILNPYIDFGQGLVDCIKSIYKENSDEFAV